MQRRITSIPDNLSWQEKRSSGYDLLRMNIESETIVRMSMELQRNSVTGKRGSIFLVQQDSEHPIPSSRRSSRATYRRSRHSTSSQDPTVAIFVTSPTEGSIYAYAAASSTTPPALPHLHIKDDSAIRTFCEEQNIEDSISVYSEEDSIPRGGTFPRSDLNPIRLVLTNPDASSDTERAFISVIDDVGNSTGSGPDASFDNSGDPFFYDQGKWRGEVVTGSSTLSNGTKVRLVSVPYKISGNEVDLRSPTSPTTPTTPSTPGSSLFSYGSSASSTGEVEETSAEDTRKKITLLAPKLDVYYRESLVSLTRSASRSALAPVDHLRVPDFAYYSQSEEDEYDQVDGMDDVYDAVVDEEGEGIFIIDDEVETDEEVEARADLRGSTERGVADDETTNVEKSKAVNSQIASSILGQVDEYMTWLDSPEYERVRDTPDRPARNPRRQRSMSESQPSTKKSTERPGVTIQDDEDDICELGYMRDQVEDYESHANIGEIHDEPRYARSAPNEGYRPPKEVEVERDITEHEGVDFQDESSSALVRPKNERTAEFIIPGLELSDELLDSPKTHLLPVEMKKRIFFTLELLSKKVSVRKLTVAPQDQAQATPRPNRLAKTRPASTNRVSTSSSTADRTEPKRLTKSRPSSMNRVSTASEFEDQKDHKRLVKPRPASVNWSPTSSALERGDKRNSGAPKRVSRISSSNAISSDMIDRRTSQLSITEELRKRNSVRAEMIRSGSLSISNPQPHPMYTARPYPELAIQVQVNRVSTGAATNHRSSATHSHPPSLRPGSIIGFSSPTRAPNKEQSGVVKDTSGDTSVELHAKVSKAVASRIILRAADPSASSNLDLSSQDSVSSSQHPDVLTPTKTQAKSPTST